MKRLIVLGILVLFLINGIYAIPKINSVSGNIEDGISITLTGNGFGTKPQAAPFRSSYLHPDNSMNFQETGIFNSDWPVAGSVMINLSEWPGINRVNTDSHKNYVRLEYSQRDALGGYSAGIQPSLPQTIETYVAWWDYFDNNFDPSVMETGAANFKWMYNSPGNEHHSALSITNNGTSLLASAHGGGVCCLNPDGTNNRTAQNANLIVPLGGGFYARPITWFTTFPFEKGNWGFFEWTIHLNSAPGIFDGWTELKRNNQVIYRTNNVDYFGTIPYSFFANVRFGGNYGWYGGSNVFYRYYGDIYIDDTISRVALCENENYSNCHHIELQIPTSWNSNSISINANPGSFTNGQNAYLYVIDQNGNISNAYPVTIGTQQSHE